MVNKVVLHLMRAKILKLPQNEFNKSNVQLLRVATLLTDHK